MADSMSTIIWYVLTQQVYETLLRMPCLYLSLQSTILGPKCDPDFRDLFESVLCDGGPPNVAADIAEEMCLGFTVGDMNAPPSLGLLRQHRLLFFLSHFRNEIAPFQRLSQKPDDG